MEGLFIVMHCIPAEKTTPTSLLGEIKQTQQLLVHYSQDELVSVCAHDLHERIRALRMLIQKKALS